MTTDIKGIQSSTSQTLSSVKRDTTSSPEVSSNKSEESSVVTNVKPEIEEPREAEAVLESFLNSVESGGQKALEAQGAGLDESRILDLLSDD